MHAGIHSLTKSFILTLDKAIEQARNPLNWILRWYIPGLLVWINRVLHIQLHKTCTVILIFVFFLQLPSNSSVVQRTILFYPGDNLAPTLKLITHLFVVPLTFPFNFSNISVSTSQSNLPKPPPLWDLVHRLSCENHNPLDQFYTHFSFYR